nr:MAG: protease polymerase P70 [Chemarfal virus 148]
MLQSGRFNLVAPPTDEERVEAITRTAGFYAETAVPDEFRGREVKISRQRIRDMFVDMNMDAVSGYPYSLRWSLKGDMVEEDTELLVDLVLQRLHALDTFDPDDFDFHSNIDLVERNLMDPISIFVKGEEHTLKKIEERRMRLIMNCSIVDEVVERLLFGCQDLKDKINCYDPCGSAGGWDWSTDEAAQRCYQSLRPWLDDAATNDASGWDWSLNKFLFEDELQVRKCLNKATEQSAWWRIARNYVNCITRSVYVLSDGTMLVTQYDGIQKSGRYTTTSSNGRMRNLVACMMGCKMSKSSGDDNLSSYHEDAVEKAKRFGIRLTDYRKVDPRQGFEFCSQIFTPEKAIPLGCAKALRNLLGKKPDIAKLQIFRREFRHSPDIGKAERALQAYGYLGLCPAGKGI